MTSVARARRTLLFGTLLALGSLLVPAASHANAASFAVIGAPESLKVRVQLGAVVDPLRIPVEVLWTGPPGEPVSTYRLQHRVDGGAWTNVALADRTKPKAVLTLDAWRVYGFRVAAADSAGRLGAWSAERVIRARQALATEETASYSGAWTRKGALSLLEGTTRVTSEAGASAQFKVSDRGIAWVATQGPGRGRAAVYVDGVRVATVSLSAATVHYRRVVWTRSWPDTAQRTVKILIQDAGTRGVDIDGLLAVEPRRPIPSLPGPATSPGAMRPATNRQPTFSTASRGPSSRRATMSTRSEAAATSQTAMNHRGAATASGRARFPGTTSTSRPVLKATRSTSGRRRPRTGRRGTRMTWAHGASIRWTRSVRLSAAATQHHPRVAGWWMIWPGIRVVVSLRSGTGRCSPRACTAATSD